MTLVSISITGPDPEWLAEHARGLVDARLAACGNIIPTVRSIYRWEDSVEDELEAYLIVHTRSEHVAAVIERTNAAHPYDTVQILATEIVDADPDYARWLYDCTEPEPPAVMRRPRPVWGRSVSGRRRSAETGPPEI